ncbi:chemotaxis protein CheW [bacterium]|nr:chemotaxis protein CheW [bacterium]
MSKKSPPHQVDEEIQFSCFYLGETLCGLDIRMVQEINDEISITQVPLSPDYVVGILNLRGQIITVIDQSRKIGLGISQIDYTSRIIIVRSSRDYVGLLVDKLAEVITINKSGIAKPPSNVNGIQGSFFYGVVHTHNNELLGLLNLDKLLSED